MFLEILTFTMLVLVIALKYGASARILKLSQELRDVESICKRRAWPREMRRT